MKRILVLLLTVVMVFSITACSTKTEVPSTAGAATASTSATTEEAATTESSGDVTISWLMNETANLGREQYEAVIDAFEKEYPNIHVDLVLQTDLSATTFSTMIAGGTLPDILHGAAHVAGMDGVLAEVPQWLSEKFKPSSLFESNGAIRTVPVCGQGVWGVIYHKDIFEAAGITKAPATWDEFCADCDTLIAKGYAPIMGWGTTNESFFSQMWIAPTLCNELRAAYPNFSEQIMSGDLHWTDPVIANNLKTFQSLSTNGYFYSGSNSLDYNNAMVEFQAGNAAMMVDGVWSLSGLDPEKYGVFILPDEAGTNSSTMFTQYWGVNENAKNKDACWTFVDWVLCGNGQQIYTDQILSKDAQISCAKEAVSYDMDPLVKDFYDMLSTRDTYVNQFEVVGEYALPSGFADYWYTALASIFFDGADVDQTLAAAETEYRTLLQEQQ